MEEIQAVKREKDLTALTVRSDDFELIERIEKSYPIRGVIKPSCGETVVFVSGFPDGGLPDVCSERGMTAITLSGDAMQGKNSTVRKLFFALRAAGIAERYISVSDIGITLYFSEHDGEMAWKILSQLT